MLRTLWNDFLITYDSIFGTGSFLVLFVVMLGFLVHERYTDGKDTEILPSILMMPGVIAAGLVKVLKSIGKVSTNKKAPSWTIKMFGVILCAFVVMISGDRILSPSFCTYSDNNMHIPEGLMGVMDDILSDCDGEVVVVATPGYTEYFDAYSSRFILPYNEPVLGDVSSYDEEDRELYLELCNKNPNMKKVSDYAKENDCKYAVLVSGKYWPEVPITEFSYALWKEADGFEIYKIKEGEGL